MFILFSLLYIYTTIYVDNFSWWIWYLIQLLTEVTSLCLQLISPQTFTILAHTICIILWQIKPYSSSDVISYEHNSAVVKSSVMKPKYIVHSWLCYHHHANPLSGSILGWLWIYLLQLVDLYILSFPWLE